MCYNEDARKAKVFILMHKKIFPRELQLAGAIFYV